jgi:hypothetical protein
MKGKKILNVTGNIVGYFIEQKEKTYLRQIDQTCGGRR